MSELIKILTTYNLFNSLLPGVVYVVFLKHYTKYDLIQTDLLTGLFLYYFIGLVISRIGSLIVEPVLKKCFPFRSYTDYIKASKKDQKIELFVEINNTYRTLISMILCLFISKLYELLLDYMKISKSLNIFLIISVIISLFIFSYKKQTRYIFDRIDSVIRKK